ncbi:McrB family protein [Rubrivirga sp.]|uniref:McrB family protein n=1 Tax=Rubrivirga sp. TaxID=1885344 RepID=UPI003C75DCD9
MTYWLWSIPPDVYPTALRTGTFALRRQGRRRLEDVQPGDRIFAYLPGRQVITGVFEAVGDPFEDATALASGRHLPHRLRVRRLAVLPEETWVSRDGIGELRVLEEYADLGPEARFRRVVQQVLHPLPLIDGKVLEFVIQARLGADPDALMAAVEAVRRARKREPASRPTSPVVAEPVGAYAAFDHGRAVEDVLEAVAARGFRFEPWQIAAYVIALRTKPFVLLAGVTGVGKSKLPVLVAEATGGTPTVLPVRPDWTDPAETLGYTDLEGRFRPGSVLRAAQAASDSDLYHTLVLDEMNLGRPEHYLAEVLSKMEQRSPAPPGYASPPLLSETLGLEDAHWQSVGLPPNLGIVGTVNVDESAHAFSRKVLDRAFVLELSARDLEAWSSSSRATESRTWPSSAWTPRAIRLGELGDVTEDERRAVERATRAVAEASAILAPAGLEVGYRARDEVALFVLHALEAADAFRAQDGASVDPLDLALLMKVVTRIDGARRVVRSATAALLEWAASGDRPATHLVEVWVESGRPPVLEGAHFPRMAARLARVLEGADEDGVASFWA